MSEAKTLKDHVADVVKEHRCNCDLDNWEPQLDSGHSHVCRIDKIARERQRDEQRGRSA